MSTLPEPGQDIVDEFVGSAHGDLDRVRDLLEQYPSLVNAPASWEETAIQAAAQTGQVELAELLLSAGAPLDICTAAMLGLAEQVEAFVRSDPEQIQARGAHSLPLLYFPVIGGHQEIAAFLLERGAEINSGQGGNTPLHGAVLYAKADLVKWLLENRADPNLVDYNGKTALELALESGQDELADLLQANQKA